MDGQAPPVADRILDIIKTHAGKVDDMTAPPMLTQRGMAAALGKSRAHIAVVLRELLIDGKAVCVLRHVPGSRARCKVYVTPQSPCLGCETSIPQYMHPMMALKFERQIAALDDRLRRLEECKVSAIRPDK